MLVGSTASALLKTNKQNIKPLPFSLCAVVKLKNEGLWVLSTGTAHTVIPLDLTTVLEEHGMENVLLLA